MADEAVKSFRVHSDVNEDYERIIEWCRENQSNFNSVINSFLPAIAYAVTAQTFEDPDTGKRYIRADFGDIFLREPYQKHT